MSSTPEKASAKHRPNPVIRYPLKLLGLYESSEDVLTPPLDPRSIHRPNIFAGRTPRAAAVGVPGPSTSVRRNYRPTSIFSQPLRGFPPLPEAADAAGPSRTQRREQPVTAPYKYGKYRSEPGGQKPTKLRRSGSLAGSSFDVGPGLIARPKGRKPHNDFIEARDRMLKVMKEHPDKVTEDDRVYYRKLCNLAQKQDFKQQLQDLRELNNRQPIDLELRRKQRKAEHARQKAQEEEEQRERLRREKEARRWRWEEQRRREEQEEAARLKKKQEKEEEEREHQRRKEELEEISRRNEEKEAALLRKEREGMMEQLRHKEELEDLRRKALEKQACLEKAEAELRSKEEDLRAQEDKLEAERKQRLQEERTREKFLRQRFRALREQEHVADFARIKTMLDERARQIEARLRDIQFSRQLSKEPSFYPMEVDEELLQAPSRQQHDHHPLYTPPPHPPQYSGQPLTGINITQPYTPAPSTQPNAGINIQIFNNFHHPAN